MKVKILGIVAVVLIVACSCGGVTDTTDYHVENFSPAVSPDGKWIAYGHYSSHPDNDVQGLCLLNISTKSSVWLYELPYSNNYILDWSPDGKRLLTAQGILTVGNKQLKPSGKPQYYRWSPDGEHIIAAGNPFVILDTLFQPVKELSFGGYHPQWLKGGMILYSFKNDTADGIAISDTAGVYPVSLLATSLYSYDNYRYSACSPDNSSIVYTIQENIYLMDMDGKNNRFLTEGNYPAWAPDSKRIVFSSRTSSSSGNVSCISYNIYMIDIDGKNFEQLTHDY